VKGGHLTTYFEREGFPGGTVEQFAWDRDGSLWATTRVGLVHFTGSRWERVTDERELGAPLGVLVDRAGTLWVASVGGLFARVAGEKGFRAIDRSITFGSAEVVLASSPDGRVWASPAEHDLTRTDRPADPQPGGFVVVHGIPRGPLLFDAEGNLWASDFKAQTLLRAPLSDLTGTGTQYANPETFSREDGLNPGRISAVV